MQLCRFMSKEELDRYLAWENLENHTDWKQEHNMTTSKGFCLFPVRETDTPEKLIHVLSGITTVQYVLEVEAPAGTDGRYRCRQSRKRNTAPRNTAGSR